MSHLASVPARVRLLAFVSALGIALAAGLVLAPRADALRVTDVVGKEMWFALEACEPITRTAAFPAELRRPQVVRPVVGARVHGLEWDTPARVTAVALSGSSLSVTLTPDPAVCGGEGDWADEWEGDSYSVAARVRGRRTVTVFVRGTGRGGSLARRPRYVPFGQRSAVVGLKWKGWNGRAAVGRGLVEFNPCHPNCAEARPQYFPVRVVLDRPRDCGLRWQYTRFRFRYTTARRPAGLGRRYRETFGC